MDMLPLVKKKKKKKEGGDVRKRDFVVNAFKVIHFVAKSISFSPALQVSLNATRTSQYTQIVKLL